MIGRGGKRGEERFKSLVMLKRDLQKEKSYLIDSRGVKRSNMEEKIDFMLSKLTDLDKKIEGMKHERYYELSKMKKMAGQKEESIRKLKMKDMIKLLLEEHKKLTSSQLSKLINLSRNRCSEYLKEMEREGIMRGTKVRQQRFYELISG